jgi:hypothetical protein
MFENVLSWFILCVILVRVLTFICLVFFPSTALLSVQLTIQQTYLSVYADLSNPLTVNLTNNICAAVSSRPSLCILLNQMLPVVKRSKLVFH